MDWLKKLLNLKTKVDPKTVAIEEAIGKNAYLVKNSEGKYGLIRRNYSIIIPLEYEEIKRNKSRTFQARRTMNETQHTDLYSSTGQCLGRNVQLLKDQHNFLIFGQENGEQKLFSRAQNRVILRRIQEATLEDAHVLAKADNMWFLLDSDGRLLFKSFSPFEEVNRFFSDVRYRIKDKDGFPRIISSGGGTFFDD